MLLINYAHPLTESQRAQVVELLDGAALDRVVEVPTQLDVEQPFWPQIAALVAETERLTGLDTRGWQTQPLLINLPALNYAAAVLLAHLHGLMGYWPTVLRVRPVAGSTPRRFEVAELLDLDALRAQAREQRAC